MFRPMRSLQCPAAGCQLRSQQRARAFALRSCLFAWLVGLWVVAWLVDWLAPGRGWLIG